MTAWKGNKDERRIPFWPREKSDSTFTFHIFSRPASPSTRDIMRIFFCVSKRRKVCDFFFLFSINITLIFLVRAKTCAKSQRDYYNYYFFSQQDFPRGKKILSIILCVVSRATTFIHRMCRVVCCSSFLFGAGRNLKLTRERVETFVVLTTN